MGSRWFGGATYDRARQRVVMPDRGGYSYEWDGSAWHRTPDAGSAGGNCFMDHSADRLITVRESGWGTGQVFSFQQRVAHDWQPMLIPGGPQDRWGTTISYNDTQNELLVFGGYDGTNLVALTGTWTFDGATWTEHFPAVSPPPRYFASMCYDSARQRTVLFGGQDTVALNDTWEWDGSNWAQVTTAASPSPRAFFAMQFDSARGVAVLVGGSSGTPPMPADLWEYDGSNWVQRTAPPLPLGSTPGPMVFDEARAEMLLIGSGTSTGRSGAVFAWDGSQWTSLPGLGDMPYVGYGATPTLDHTGTRVLRLGGTFNGQTTLSQALLSWDGSNWQTLATGGPPLRTAPLMWSMTSASYIFGGVDANAALLNDTWQWDGVNWTQVTTATSPPGRTESAIAFHPTQNHALLFGGADSSSAYGALSDTWRFDGTNWQQLSNSPQPGPRRMHTMAYDPIRDRVVLYGGQRLSQFPGGSTVYEDTWEHDGTSWTMVLNGVGPGPSPMCTMAFDAVRQTIVSIENDGLGFRLWEYDGLAWAPLSVDGDSASANPLAAGFPFAVTGPNGRLNVSETLTMLELIPTPASAKAYGTACTPAAPHLTASDIPDLGQPNFALEVTVAPSNAPVAIIGADQDVNVPVLGCTLLVAPGVSSVLLTSDALGYARAPLGLPNTPALLGGDFYFQAATFDVLAPSGITLSRGLRVTLGQ